MYNFPWPYGLAALYAPLVRVAMCSVPFMVKQMILFLSLSQASCIWELAERTVRIKFLAMMTVFPWILTPGLTIKISYMCPLSLQKGIHEHLLLITKNMYVIKVATEDVKHSSIIVVTTIIGVQMMIYHMCRYMPVWFL